MSIRIEYNACLCRQIFSCKMDSWSGREPKRQCKSGSYYRNRLPIRSRCILQAKIYRHPMKSDSLQAYHVFKREAKFPVANRTCHNVSHAYVSRAGFHTRFNTTCVTNLHVHTALQVVRKSRGTCVNDSCSAVRFIK